MRPGNGRDEEHPDQGRPERKVRSRTGTGAPHDPREEEYQRGTGDQRGRSGKSRATPQRLDGKNGQIINDRGAVRTRSSRGRSSLRIPSEGRIGWGAFRIGERAENGRIEEPGEEAGERG